MLNLAGATRVFLSTSYLPIRFTLTGVRWACVRVRKPCSGGGFLIYRRWSKQHVVDNVRPEVNLLSAFTLMIVGAFAAGLPLALAIIWVCS